MKRKWSGPGLAACCAVLALFFSFHHAGNEKLLLVQDAFDPMAEIIGPHAGDTMERLNPYQLGQRLPGLNGAALVFGSQARHYERPEAAGSYLPLYRTTIVIALNRRGNSAGAVTGWRTLLESKAVVLPPHHGTEGGRLAAIALARGLGAAEGDLQPAVDAYASLQRQNRLNCQDQYHSRDYRAMFDPRRLAEHDAVILWDYQAAALQRSSPDWDIIIPEEGPFTVDCGLVFAGDQEGQKNLEPVKTYLLSTAGQQALREAGFSPPAGPVDLSAWDRARLSYNPAFRRAVLAVKRYGPASLQERLLLQSAILLLFCIAAQRILRRIPRGPFRATSFLSMLFVLLWMLLGLLKNLVTTPDLTRYCWFATYIPRHLLPVCWFCMCYVNRHNRLPSPKSLAALFGGTSLLTVFVFTNDLHRLVFVYTAGEAAYWTDQYVNGWGYYLSLLWIFLLCLAGLALLTSKEWTRQQKRRLLYAGILFLALLAYQLLYIAGVKHILDLDIPTTVAILFLVFNAAAQRERFMGASLLELPLFQNSPYAISIYDSGGQTVYRNRVMQSLQAEGALLPDPGLELEETPVIPWRRRLFKPHGYRLDQGRALLLEDITEIKQLERSLEETQIKLRAAQEILMRQAGESRSLTGRLEQERYSLQMNKLFREKLEEIQHQLGLLTGAEAGEQDHALLRRTRFLLCICQQRLRFIIRSLETHPILPAELIESYAAGVIRDGQRMGLDGVITCAVRGFCPPSIVPPLLHSIDSICLHAFHLPGASLICRLEAGEQGVNLNALLSQEGDRPFTAKAAPPGELAGAIAAIGGILLDEAEEEGRLIRLHIPYRGGEK